MINEARKPVGQVAARKRGRFAELADDELAAMETAVRDAMEAESR